MSLCNCESSFAGVKTDGQNSSSGCAYFLDPVNTNVYTNIWIHHIDIYTLIYSLFATKVFDHVTTPPKAME